MSKFVEANKKIEKAVEKVEKKKLNFSVLSVILYFQCHWLVHFLATRTA